MFESSTTVEIVVEKPVSFPKITVKSFSQIIASFISNNGLKDSSESSVDKLLIIGLRNDIVTLTMQMFLFLRTVKEKTIQLKRTQERQRNRP